MRNLRNVSQKFVTVLALVALLLTTATPAFAGAGYDTFCAGETALTASAIPAESPCLDEGSYFVIGTDNAGTVYHDWESVVGLGATVSLVYFMPGETGDGMANPGNYPLEDAPDVFTELSCTGGSALVYQSPDNSGDGVTLSPYDEWGCEQVVPLFVVEPWYGDTTNADAGCFVSSWQELGEFAERTGWENGSAWVVPAAFVEHPMVVDCSEVAAPAELGLNPNEHQILPEREDWVDNRAATLLESVGMTLDDYCSSYDELLARLVCPAPDSE